ncbi:MAG: MotA/TolQ/ExbB proton channel family protein [Cyclobacteriaceae bacterium]
MFELFNMGGPLFMSILTILLIGVIAAVVKYLGAVKKKAGDLDLIKSIGLFALVFGIFGQLLGLFQAFQSIEMAGTVSPALLVGGLKVSMITTLYGMTIFLISYGIWFFLSLKKN